MRLLRIDSSARTASVTRQLTVKAAEAWKENNPDGDVLHRDLSAIDQIVRIGKTFGYGPDGPRGLLEMKKVIVITARGGAYEKGTPREAFDFQEPYLRHVLGFIGLTDVTFIHAENQSRDQAAASLESAGERITEVLADRNRLAVAFDRRNNI